LGVGGACATKEKGLDGLAESEEDRDRKRAAVESAEIENPMLARILPSDLRKEEARLTMDEIDA
jgi:hypothetical protein